MLLTPELRGLPPAGREPTAASGPPAAGRNAGLFWPMSCEKSRPRTTVRPGDVWHLDSVEERVHGNGDPTCPPQ
jgi:hypothetical protein